MSNYVMATLLVYLISNTFFSLHKNSSPVGRLTSPSGTLPNLFGGAAINAGVIVAAVVLLGGWVLMSKSRLGFELELSGTSPGASAFAGIGPARVFTTAFLISGAVVGLAGGVQVLGRTHQLQAGFGGDVGVLAITVAFVGRNRPLGVLLAALLYGILQTGGLQMQGSSGVSYQLSNVIEGVIVLFMTAPALVAEIYRLRPVAGANLRLAMSRGWGK
jgi:simple sugar transport system permease protein